MHLLVAATTYLDDTSSTLRRRELQIGPRRISETLGHAIGARSMIRDLEDRAMLKKSVRHVVDYLEPASLLWYGSDQYSVADYPRSKGIPTHVYPAKGRGSLYHHDGGSDR